MKYLIALKTFNIPKICWNILILTPDTNEINAQQDTFQKNSVLNFTHELNKNNKISFLDVLIDTNNNNQTKLHIGLGLVSVSCRSVKAAREA